MIKSEECCTTAFLEIGNPKIKLLCCTSLGIYHVFRPFLRKNISACLFCIRRLRWVFSCIKTATAQKIPLNTNEKTVHLSIFFSDNRFNYLGILMNLDKIMDGISKQIMTSLMDMGNANTTDEKLKQSKIIKNLCRIHLMSSLVL